MNRHVTEAKSVLLDPVARADYDAQLQYGDEISLLFEEAQDAMEVEEYSEAASLFKEILALHPRSLDARNRLALALAYDERFGESEAQYLKLIDLAPASALYTANLGHTYWRWADTDTTKLVQAEHWLRSATGLESFNSSHYISLARVLVDLDRYDEAEMAIEDAIQADGKVDVDDIDAMMELAHVYVLSCKRDKVADVATRIKSVLPDSIEARRFAAFRFIQIAVQLSTEHDAYEAATVFTKAAKTITDDLGDASAAVASIEKIAALRQEVMLMLQDKTIAPDVVPKYFGALMLQHMDLLEDESQLDNLLNVARTWPHPALIAGVVLCKQKYPTVLTELDFAVKDFIAAGRPITPAPTRSSGFGCTSIFAILGLGYGLIQWLISLFD